MSTEEHGLPAPRSGAAGRGGGSVVVAPSGRSARCVAENAAGLETSSILLVVEVRNWPGLKQKKTWNISVLAFIQPVNVLSMAGRCTIPLRHRAESEASQRAVDQEGLRAGGGTSAGSP